MSWRKSMNLSYLKDHSNYLLGPCSLGALTNYTHPRSPQSPLTLQNHTLNRYERFDFCLCLWNTLSFGCFGTSWMPVNQLTYSPGFASAILSSICSFQASFPPIYPALFSCSWDTHCSLREWICWVSATGWMFLSEMRKKQTIRGICNSTSSNAYLNYCQSCWGGSFWLTLFQRYLQGRWSYSRAGSWRGHYDPSSHNSTHLSSFGQLSACLHLFQIVFVYFCHKPVRSKAQSCLWMMRNSSLPFGWFCFKLFSNYLPEDSTNSA